MNKIKHSDIAASDRASGREAEKKNSVNEYENMLGMLMPA